MKIKESEKIYKYLDIARSLRKVWNMRITVIPIVISVLGTVRKGWERGLKDLVTETMQTTSLLGSARIPRRVLET